MITEEKAMEIAMSVAEKHDAIDSRHVLIMKFVSQVETLAAGVKDGPWARDRWLVSFARVKTGHPLDDVFNSQLIVVDAESGEARVQDNL